MCSLTLMYSLCVFICVGFQNIVDGAEEKNTCTTSRLKYCKLNIDPSLFTKGAKGERGDNGALGLRGEKGYRGKKGEPGAPGLQGPKGETGEMGMKGEKGDTHETPSTIVGPPGSPGNPGTLMNKARKGTSTFPCKNDNSADDKTRPVTVAPFMKKLKKKFEVNCGPRPREICVPKQKLLGAFYNYKDNVKPFWTSEVGMDLMKMYGLTTSDIESLKGNSTYIRQTLRYHCNNSTPYSARDITKAVRLLTWNDKVVGPYPSAITTLFYSVPIASDGCSNGGNGLSYTDIVIQSAVLNRLPIIDVQINDIRHESQSFYIEHEELCFAVFYLSVENSL